MDKDCISFDIGSMKITADQATLEFDEHRKICNKDGHMSFEYGKMVGDNKIDFFGESVGKTDEKNPKNTKFVIVADLNGKKVEEKEITFKEFEELFAHSKESQLLKDVMMHVSKTKQKAQPKQKTQQKQKSQSSEAKKITFEPGKKEGHVINPETGAEIKIDGPTYKDLCNTGKYVC